jgi:hypothetical protein
MPVAHARVYRVRDHFVSIVGVQQINGRVFGISHVQPSVIVGRFENDRHSIVNCDRDAFGSIVMME